MIRAMLRERRRHERPAILKEPRSVSYGGLARRADDIQAALHEYDILRGRLENRTDMKENRGNMKEACADVKEIRREAEENQRFGDGGRKPVGALLLPDGEKFISGLFALLQEGWTAFPLNASLTETELLYLLSRAKADVVITCGEFREKCVSAAEKLAQKPLVICEEDVGKHSGTPPDLRPAESCGTMLLLASSGTTGKPKLVQLSEDNVEFNVRANLNHMGYEIYGEISPVYALGTPFSAVYGLMMIFSCVRGGFPMLPLAGEFTLEHLYRYAEKYRISHYDGGTTAAILMDKTAGRHIPYDISSFKYFGFGGSRAPDGTLRRLTDAFPGIRFWSGYGMTEAGPLIAQPLKLLPENKTDSAGLPLPGTNVRIETAEGITAEPNIEGEIIVRGPNVMKGYYGDEAATKEILRNGWLHTGDIGFFDEDGYLYVCGRKKNMILVRGFSVYPEEIENCILACPLVKECAVYGFSGEEGNEEVRAYIVPAHAGVKSVQIREWCAERLTACKLPSEINFTDRIEKTSTGKTIRAIRTKNRRNCNL